MVVTRGESTRESCSMFSERKFRPIQALLHKCLELCVHTSYGSKDRHLHSSLDSRHPHMGRVASGQVTL